MREVHMDMKVKEHQRKEINLHTKKMTNDGIIVCKEMIEIIMYYQLK